MRKIICFFLAISVLLGCGCKSNTENWQKIHIENCGTLKIPPEWNFFTEDGVMYIMDGEKPIMITCKRTGESESNLYYNDYKYVGFITSAVFSNGVIYGKAEYLYNNNYIELYYLDLGSIRSDAETIEFAVWDQGMSEELLISIARSFVSD